MKYKLLLLGALAGMTPMIAAAPAKAQSGEYCREYTKTVTVGGRRESAYGTACYRPDGSWEIVNLRGPSNDARADVREVIYQDVGARPYHSARFNNVVVVERGYRPARFVPRYRHNNHATYYRTARHSSPFVFNFSFGDDNDHRHRTKKVVYKKPNKGRGHYKARGNGHHQNKRGGRGHR